MSFSEKLRSIRKGKKYSLRDISENTGIPYRSLQSYEMGVRTPSIEVLIKLSEFFQVTADYLLDIDSNTDEEKKNSVLSETDEAFRFRIREDFRILSVRGEVVGKSGRVPFCHSQIVHKVIAAVYC